MEYVIFFTALALILIVISVLGIVEHIKNKKNFFAYMQKSYGTFQEQIIDAEKIKRISKYYEKHKGEGKYWVDDITWNDLEMNRLFSMMDCAQSSAGEEYLYYMLRNMNRSKEELIHQEKIVQYFDTHEKDRIDIQYLCKDLGKTGKYSIYDYLDYLDNIESKSNWKQHFMNALIFLSLGLMIFQLGIGLLALFVVICINIVTYFKEKSKIGPYVTSFIYFLRIIQCAKKLDLMQCPVLEESRELLNRERNKMKRFSNRSFMILSETGSSSNPLSIIVDYAKMIFHVDIMVLYTILDELKLHADSVDRMVTQIGSIESAILIGNFRKALPYACIPEYTDKISLTCQDIYHPYLKNPVSNSITVQGNVLLTGSNASGKSTFLKTIALNIIMAQTLHTVTARTYTACFYQLYTSMSLRDDLLSGESYYIVEIRALKRILDQLTSDKRPLICFVDEVLRGTNTVERIAASNQILKSFSGKNAICFAATHDIELTDLLSQYYENYHFSEDVVDGDVLFDYQLQKGPAVSRNAIKLLEMMGYDSSIVEKANQQAEKFVRTGEWK